MTVTYRGAIISPNFISVHGTGAALKKPRGYSVDLPGYGFLGWEPSMRAAKRHVDYLRDQDCAPGVARAFAKIDARAA